MPGSSGYLLVVSTASCQHFKEQAYLSTSQDYQARLAKSAIEREEPRSLSKWIELKKTAESAEPQ